MAKKKKQSEKIDEARRKEQATYRSTRSRDGGRSDYGRDKAHDKKRREFENAQIKAKRAEAEKSTFKNKDHGTIKKKVNGK